MRLRAQAPQATLLTILLHTITTSATPFALDTEVVESQNGTIVKRCANPCGYYGQVCCESGQTCTTDSYNQAQCSSGSSSGSSQPQAQAAGGNGYWQYSTSIWTETDTNLMTSIVSYYVASTPAAVVATSTYCPPSAIITPAVGASPTAVALTCNWAGGERSCGNICCDQGQYCQVSGQCGPAQSDASVGAAVRPTSSGMDVVTQQSVSTTTTQPFTPAIATGQALPVTATSAQTSGGLSGGAIAGIVIGILLLLIIAALILLCCCFKAVWKSLVALFSGKKKNNRRRTVTEYESYHRSGRGDPRARTWYGGVANRPKRVERTTTVTRKKTGLAAGGLSGLAAAMGLRKKNDDRRRRRDEKSDYSSSYDSYSSYSDPSSSDRRTADTRRTRDTRRSRR